MSQSLLLKAAGLYTFPNTLSEVPQGALTVADNTVIDRNGVIEPRRGFQQYGTDFGIGTDIASQLMTYKKRVLMQYNDTIQYDSDGNGTWIAFDGSFPVVEVGLRTKYIEANGNFYFTTANGIKAISAVTSADFTPATHYIRDSGGVEALDVNGTLDYSTGGWFIYQTSEPGQTKVAYRVTWAFKDANGNLIEGVPSSRLVLTNYSETASANVVLNFQIPSQILDLAPDNTQFFYTIYRTAIVQTSVGVTLNQLDPGDEEYQVIQAFPTPAELATGSVTVEDRTPDSFRANGVLLYTNPISGEGILQSNYPPPISKDITLYQQTLFFANTQTIQKFNLSLLGTSALVSGTSTITITQGSTSNTYVFVGSPQIQQLTFNNQAGTTDGGYFLINSAQNTRKYFVWFNKSGSPEIQDLTFDTYANTTDGGYFLINSANDTNKYFVWFDKTGTTTIPSGPDTAGRTGLRVVITAGMTDAQVAAVVNNIFNATADFSATVAAAVVRVTNLANGVTTAVLDGAVPVGGVFAHTVFQAGTNPTTQPSGSDTVGRLAIPVDISQSITDADVALATSTALSNTTDFSAAPIAPGSPTIEVTNTDNGVSDDAVDSVIVPTPLVGPVVVVQSGTGESLSYYTFTVSPANATVGDTYTNNGQTFTVLDTIVASTTLRATGTGNPNPSGILTRSSGSGDLTITYSAFTLTNEVLLGNNISPAISIDETARSLVQTINANHTSVINAFYVSGPTDLPGLMLFQAKDLSDPAFSITADSTTTGNEFSPALPTSGNSVISTNEVEANAIYYSKFQQPEAVPIVNKFNVGPKDKAILRILPIRTGLMIFKEDGIYQLTGTNGQFVINPFDSSALILAPDSAQVLNNQIYMFSTQGVVTVTDTGVNVISRPIENSLQTIITSAYNYIPNTFGVSYEADRSYLLWTVTNTDDNVPTQCFRYNTFTNAWTRWPITKNCGVVLINQNILYLGPTDGNFIEKERKNVNRTDYADRVYGLTLSDNFAPTPTKIALSSTTHVQSGSVLVQTQNLTIYEYNQMLQKLDLETNTTQDYFETLGIAIGANLRASVDNLALKLDSDPGLAETNFFSSLGGGPTFTDIQNDFNIIVGLLNANINVYHQNFPTSVGTKEFEALILDKIVNTSYVDLIYSVPLVVGPINLYEGIMTNIVWAPQSFGDPSIAKHVSEGTFLFDNNDFYSAYIGYASDLSPNFETVGFTEAGIGDWGYFVWDNQNWGGNGSQVPLRTYIPRNKQYCRFLLPNFSHLNAREKFSLFGTSLTFRPIGERAYRS